MGGTYLIRHLTISLFWSSPGIAPVEVDAVVALPAAAPSCLAEAVLTLSPASQLGGRGTVLWLHGAALSGDIRQHSPLGGPCQGAGRHGMLQSGSACAVLGGPPGFRNGLWRLLWKSKSSPSRAALGVTL